MTLITRICLIVADLIVVAVTLLKTYRQTKMASAVDASASLSGTLLRDGEYLLLSVVWLLVLTRPFVRQGVYTSCAYIEYSINIVRLIDIDYSALLFLNIGIVIVDAFVRSPSHHLHPYIRLTLRLILSPPL